MKEHTTAADDLSLQKNRVEFKHLDRPRLNKLMAEAAKNPLVIVYAGAGCGKSNAVYDFVCQNEVPTVWVQLSEQDNIAPHFWENFVNALASVIRQPVDKLRKMGFPDTEEKMERYFELCNRALADLSLKKCLIVIDDFHLIHASFIIHFLERFLQGMPENHTVILNSREYPQLDVERLQSSGHMGVIQEEDLNFTENEVSLYLQKQHLSVAPEMLHKIMLDMNGWAFAVNLVAQSLLKSPGYEGYTRNAVKKNIFEQIERSIWEKTTDPLKHFLVRLSLIEHLSADLIELLAAGDDALLAAFKKQNAYIHYDKNIDAYLIHQLYLEFLYSKQALLTEEEKRETYEAAALWCQLNNYIVNALDYYEKIGDYESIIFTIFSHITTYEMTDMACYMWGILERAPAGTADRTPFFAAAQLFVLHRSGRWAECLELGKQYEEKFKAFAESDRRWNHELAGIYCGMAIAGLFLCTQRTYERLDAGVYFTKMDEYFSKSPIYMGNAISFYHGAWLNYIGSSRKGALEMFNEDARLAVGHISHCQDGMMSGYDDLCEAELKFYKGDMEAAKSFLLVGAEHAGANRQYDLTHRALFYMMRIAAAQGDQALFDQAFRDISELKNEDSYQVRFVTCDIAAGWYYYILRRPEMIPGWLKERFAPYIHPYVLENFGNQMKARFHFLVKNFPPLLAYIEEVKQRESGLYGRVEMLALEACALYQMKDKAGALVALREAWEEAAPNEILAPFIELGKDMRTLTSVALHETDPGIPAKWLESVNRKAHLYSKHQAMLIAKYEKDVDAGGNIPLSPREVMILQDLYKGLSRADIAEKQQISVSTVNMNVHSICTKLQARNTADVIRIAAEQKLV